MPMNTYTTRRIIGQGNYGRLGLGNEIYEKYAPHSIFQDIICETDRTG
ncbi:hypothetical protein O3G_MSEX000552, partial [Manduca sexta]